MSRKNTVAAALIILVLATAATLALWEMAKWRTCRRDLQMVYSFCCMNPPGEAEGFPHDLAGIPVQYPDAPIVPRLGRYRYVAGLNAASPPQSVICFCDLERFTRTGTAVLFVNGTIQWVRSDDFERIMREHKQMKGPNKASEATSEPARSAVSSSPQG